MKTSFWLLGIGLAACATACGGAGCGGAQTKAEPGPEPERETFEPAARDAEAPGGAEGADDPTPASAVAHEVAAFDADEPAASLAAASAGFAAGLWAELRDEEDGNLVVSPASIHFALGMALAGAGGETGSQLAGALGAGDDPEAFHAAVGEALARLNDPERETYELSVANRLFGEASYAFRDAFLQRVARSYGAPLEELDFRGAPEAARAHVNEWIEEATNGRIRDLLPEGSIHRETRMVLTNAVYFLGDWVHAFDEDRTRDDSFYAPAGERQVPMMRQRESFPYAAGEGVQVLEMPYEGEDLGLVVVLPEERDGLAEVEARLTAEAIDAWTSGLRPREVNVVMPRYELDPAEPLALSSALEGMGITDAFSPQRADFSPMADPADNEGMPLVLDQVFHKAFVSVDEEGTEAAAATGAVIGVTSAPAPAERIDFVVDRPFLFLIRERQTGLVLFMGRVTDPSA